MCVHYSTNVLRLKQVVFLCFVTRTRILKTNYAYPRTYEFYFVRYSYHWTAIAVFKRNVSCHPTHLQAINILKKNRSQSVDSHSSVIKKKYFILIIQRGVKNDITGLTKTKNYTCQLHVEVNHGEVVPNNIIIILFCRGFDNRYDRLLWFYRISDEIL